MHTSPHNRVLNFTSTVHYYVVFCNCTVVFFDFENPEILILKNEKGEVGYREVFPQTYRSDRVTVKNNRSVVQLEIEKLYFMMIFDNAHI